MADHPIEIFDMRCPERSRHFARVRDRFGPCHWPETLQKISAIPGVAVTQILDSIPQALVDFTFRGHEFSLDTQFGEFWLFVADPECPNEVLVEVAAAIRDL